MLQVLVGTSMLLVDSDPVNFELAVLDAFNDKFEIILGALRGYLVLRFENVVTCSVGGLGS
jgi:hypothetical protein